MPGRRRTSAPGPRSERRPGRQSARRQHRRARSALRLVVRRCAGSASVRLVPLRAAAEVTAFGEPCVDECARDRPTIGKVPLRPRESLHVRAAEPARILELGRIVADRARAFDRGAVSQHQRPGEGPRLRGEIGEPRDLKADLLAHLPHHRFLNALTRLDETGKRRMQAGWPCRLACQDAARVAAFAVGDEHDHHRIGAREVLLGARFVRAYPHMAAVAHMGRLTAAPAEPVLLVPVHHAADVSEDRAIIAREPGANPPQIPKRGAVAESGQIAALARRQVSREPGTAVRRSAEKHERFSSGSDVLCAGAGCRGKARRLAVDDEIPAAPIGQNADGRRTPLCLNPGIVGSACGDAVEAAAGVQNGFGC
ncbi:hypothetical protein DF3PA_70023 [Candidatus Defluviicoccus seviourii]|uniref:Uncharacterized protein n=1 Tax=Candidatus Defluviicoccus seviourii TaxID=2565273 RepID=A0A564WGX4_9PROT|nr:hypothetical protein DF3PA_70023 [Candidatus Defluviicoccus seviourii]